MVLNTNQPRRQVKKVTLTNSHKNENPGPHATGVFKGADTRYLSVIGNQKECLSPVAGCHRDARLPYRAAYPIGLLPNTGKRGV